jgi:hypothetical protein
MYRLAFALTFALTACADCDDPNPEPEPVPTVPLGDPPLMRCIWDAEDADPPGYLYPDAPQRDCIAYLGATLWGTDPGGFGQLWCEVGGEFIPCL